MNKYNTKLILMLFFGALLSVSVHASKPLWLFTPLTQTTVSVPSSGMSVVKYQVLNQSKKTHTLYLKKKLGIEQSVAPFNCPNPFTLAYQQSCILTLVITADALIGDIFHSPKICDQGNPLQCYQPSFQNSLVVTKVPGFLVEGTVSGLANGDSVTLQNNATNTLAVNVNGRFTFSNTLKNGDPYSVTILKQPVASTCVVTNGSGTINGADVSDVKVSCTLNTTILSPSLMDLALNVSGATRVITITNTGTTTATNLTLTFPTWPAGTSDGTTCGSSLSPSASCTITVTPGASATSSCSTGIAPTAGVIQITSTESNPVSINVVVLDYGCIYQGGYLFFVNDATPNNSSISGKVMALTDESTPYSWGSTGGTTAISRTDGEANSSVLNSPTYPAAAACLAKIDQSYFDWYLPAICEIGDGNSICSSLSLQNMRANLYQSGIGGLLGGTNRYWSSTQKDSINGWYQRFSDNLQEGTTKTIQYNVRCARSF